MKILTTREFAAHFARHKKDMVLVKHRGQAIGTWTPLPKKLTKLDVMARLKKNFSRPLPFTGADLLKAGKKH